MSDEKWAFCSQEQTLLQVYQQRIRACVGYNFEYQSESMSWTLKKQLSGWYFKLFVIQIFTCQNHVTRHDFLHASCPILTSGSENSNLGMITFLAQVCNFWSMFGENTIILSIKSSDGFHWFCAQTPNNDEIGTAGSALILRDSQSDQQKPLRNLWWRIIEASCAVLFSQTSP